MYSHRLDAHSELRTLETTDADELFALVDANRAYLREWLPWVDGTRGPSDSREFIEATQAQAAANRGFQAGIFHDGRLAGLVGFHPLDWTNRRATIGYWLAADAQGHGLMTRAVEAVVTHAFEIWGMNKVEIRAAVGNHKSRAIPQRLGFVEEGVLRDAEWLYDHYVDLVSYGQLARERQREPRMVD